MSPRRSLAALAAGLVLAGPAQARPFQVEDLLRLESFGQAKVDPTGRWLVLERRGPHLSAPSFHYEPNNAFAVDHLLKVDLEHPATARPLIAGDPVGVSLGAFSPDGRRLAVFRLRRHSWRLGIAQSDSGAVRWLALTPDLPVETRTLQWRSNRELLAIVDPAGRLPRPLALADRPAELDPPRWRAADAGRPAFTAVGSGAFLGVRPHPGSRRLLSIDAASGLSRILATGAFEDLELSPDRRKVALIVTGDDIPMRADHPAQGPYGSATRARRLWLLDLASGRLTRPCPSCDLASHLLTWSPSSSHLLVFARGADGAWPHGQFLSVTAADGAVRRIDTPGVTPLVQLRPEIARGAWLGEDPVVLGRDPAGHGGWWRIAGEGAIPLLPAQAGAPDHLDPTPTGLLAVSGGQAWTIDAEGAHRLPVEGLTLAPRRLRFVEGRLAFNETDTTSILLARRGHGDGDQLLALGSPQGPATIPLAPTEGRLLAYAPSRKMAVMLATDRHGVAQVRLRGADGQFRVVATINARLAAIEPARLVQIDHPGPDGAPLRSWLYLPPSTASRPPPLVVLPYLGPRLDAPLETQGPGYLLFAPNAQLLVGHGYAVLIPSLLRAPGKEPMDGLAERLLAIVEAAAREAPGAFDPQRLALWGHSYGGYTVEAVIGQSDRFTAAIASAGPSDLIGMWGTFGATWRADPTEGLGVSWSSGWTETAQADMGAPPWADPQRYIRNSPIFFADRIHTPLLILHGHDDQLPIGQAEEMFSALYRQNKDAELVTYWGEGHFVASPGNVRDLYGRVFRWLDEHLAGGPWPRPSCGCND